MTVYEGMNTLIFFLGSSGVVTILFLKLYNLFHKAEWLSFQSFVLWTVASFVAFGVALIGNVLATDIMVASFFTLVSVLFVVSFFVSIGELLMIVAGIPSGRERGVGRRGQSNMIPFIVIGIMVFIGIATVFIIGGEDDLLIESDDINPNFDIIPYTHNGSNAVWDFRTDGGNYELDITNY